MNARRCACQGRPGALCYDRKHRIISALAARTRNAEWQRDLSVSFNKIGDVQRARGNPDAALKAYEDIAIADS